MVVLLVVSLVLLGLPGLARPVGRRVAPREWARLCVVALGGGAVLLELLLVLHAAPTVLRAAGVPLIAAACERMLGPLLPGGAAVGWVAAVAAVVLPVLGSIGLQRARRQRGVLRVERHLGQHRHHGDHELVVLPTAHLVAVSVPGHPRGQVVISQGLVDALGANELEAVLGHEAAHLDRGHHRHLLLATALEHAFAFFPPVRRSTAALRASLERWADEDAAGASAASRQALRRALVGVTAALVAEPSVAAFTTAETVLERLDALDGAMPRPSTLLRGSLYVPGTALAVLAGVTLLSCGTDIQAAVASAGACCT